MHILHRFQLKCFLEKGIYTPQFHFISELPSYFNIKFCLCSAAVVQGGGGGEHIMFLIWLFKIEIP